MRPPDLEQSLAVAHELRGKLKASGVRNPLAKMRHSEFHRVAALMALSEVRVLTVDQVVEALSVFGVVDDEFARDLARRFPCAVEYAKGAK